MQQEATLGDRPQTSNPPLMVEEGQSGRPVTSIDSGKPAIDGGQKSLDKSTFQISFYSSQTAFKSHLTLKAAKPEIDI
jgi:hypothetical protein